LARVDEISGEPVANYGSEFSLAADSDQAARISSSPHW
jgi:hypothetical protein